ncbi:DUF2795 domain-containing protein [Solwaraspora sp. WMMD1047]|uniref:DUF2795 domain-containing protein n=1 Tax=Solwaraspora sp. WMMD1047 TaxID=3016102 RepID=UPI002415ABFC|nr:DUF2795 domain-containing protein [Solwaraspora sp. WMMD1047]MDG4831303.1 DUF2795 domain-containing protein [Solwaraspora sp. WMMD1047]
MVSDADVLRHLSAADYPAHRDDLVRTAERAGAPPDVLRALRAMPPVEYGNSGEVARSARTAAAPEETPAAAAAKARNRHQRVAQHLRGI